MTTKNFFVIVIIFYNKKLKRSFSGGIALVTRSTNLSDKENFRCIK